MEAQSLVAQLLSGAAGGNIAGALFRSSSLGTLGNSIVGLVGGPIGGLLLAPWGNNVGMAAEVASGIDAAVVSSLLCGCIGGVVLTTFIGAVRQLVSASK